jgi:hypothetical protein
MDILTLIIKCLLNRKLEGVNGFTSESWAASPSSTIDESSDVGMLITVIVLAVVILLLLVGAGVVYLLYIRSVFWAYM